MVSSLDGLRDQNAQPYGDESKNQAAEGIERSLQKCAAAQCGERLPLIRRKGAVGADKDVYKRQELIPAQGVMQPFEVGMAGRFNPKDEELRCLVAMQLKQARFEGSELIGAGLEQEERLRGGLDLALPAVDGLRGGDQSGAGNQPLLHQSAAQACGLLRTGRGGKDDAGWGAGFGQDILVAPICEWAFVNPSYPG